MSNSMDGPLGPLRGMFYDPIRRKYFPNPIPSSSVPNQPRPKSPHGARAASPTSQDRKRKDRNGGGEDGLSSGSGIRNADAGPGPGTIASRRRPARLGRQPFRPIAPEYRFEAAERDIWTNLVYRDTIRFHLQGQITAIHPGHRDSQYLVIGEDGEDGELRGLEEDSHPTPAPLVEPWICPSYKRSERIAGFELYGGDDDDPEYELSATYHTGIPNGDLPNCFTSFGRTVTVGMGRKLISFDFVKDSDEVTIEEVKGLSDVMALDQACPNIVYAGLRNSDIHSIDLRQFDRGMTRIASLKHKAVVGVKRLSDAAVPYGLLAAGMGDKLSIFDIRFGNEPIRELPDYINPFYSDLALSTTSDDKYIFAGSADNRIRAWSSSDGSRLLPPPGEIISTDSSNPLTRKFEGRVSAISARDDKMMDVGVGTSVHRFARPSA